MIRFVFWVFALVAVARLAYDMKRLDLTTESSPLGIVSLELARTPEEVKSVLEGWDDKAEARAKKSIAIDGTFIFAYVLALVLSLWWASEQAKDLAADLAPRRLWRTLALLAMVLAVAQLVTGVLDVIENRGMGKYLAGEIEAEAVDLVWKVATAKFAIAAAGIVVWAAVLGGWLYLPVALYRRIEKQLA
jgi:hypothetical protein